MVADISKFNDVTVVRLNGRLEIDKVKSISMQKDMFNQGKIVVVLDKLSFVGSSGIQLLFQTLADIQKTNPRMRISGVRPEFLRLIEFSKIAELQFDINIEESFQKFNFVD